MPTLDWIGKKAVINHHLTVPYRLLKGEEELSVGEAGSGNLLVQGDNLLALKALLPYYAGQVKCIYIDPPYNTGNEGWVYNDNNNAPEIKKWLGRTVGSESEDLSRHDKWLCMMYPRLSLLKQLLHEDGAIFISIDDNEVAALRLLMDEIFGPTNFIANVIWEKNYAPKASARHFSESHDHIIIYARSGKSWGPNLLPRTEKQDRAYKNRDNDPRGAWRPNNLAARNFYSKGTYAITCPSGRVIQGPPKGSYWRVSEETFWKLNQDGRIWWGKDGSNVPAPKIFLSEVKQGVVPMTIWPYREVGHTQDAKKEVVEILPDAETTFITPKPISLLTRIILLATEKDSLILDSFAGSGTTGHAVMKLNATDGGNRRFILVEMEDNIARKITAERIKRAINGYGDTPGLGGGFRFATLGTPLFDEHGQISEDVRFSDLARHVYFSETGEPQPNTTNGKTALIGVCGRTAYYLLFNGILGDKTAAGGNVLTDKILRQLPAHPMGADNPRVIFGEGCRLGAARLEREGIIFKQLPYEIKVN